MSQPTRFGIVLGGGGVLGAAWMIATLRAYEEQTGIDPRSAEVLVGTSAGSTLAAMLGCGVGTETLLNNQRGITGVDDPDISYDYDNGHGGALPSRPKLRPGSRGLLRNVALHPRRFPPMAAMTAFLPAGVGSLEPLAALIDAVVPTPGGWAPHRATWIVGMDYETGKRVVFGREGAPLVSLTKAVTASCSIPGWYRPTVIGGRRYVDGGACSPTSLDLLAGRGLDEVLVLAPMCSYEFDSPESVIGKLERAVRKQFTKRLSRETQRVRESGTKVTVVTPGRVDLEAIGVNVMDHRRRELVLETAYRSATAVFGGDGGLTALDSVG